MLICRVLADSIGTNLQGASRMGGHSTPEDEIEVAAALRKMGLLRIGENLSLTPLGGGVSCDVYRAEIKTRIVCVKRALPKLRVEADWRAPAERAASEVEWLRLVARIEPRLVPRVLGVDNDHHLFVMEYLPSDSHPVWKSQLAHGEIDIAFASAVGAAIARIHSATAHKDDIAAQFANGAQFHALRIEPYLLYAASKHPIVTGTIQGIAQNIETARLALMHGDVSPKNILRGSQGPVFLDAETACYGDPAFDLAFCLNHLLLKCVWHPQWSAAYLDSYSALARSYLSSVNWEEPSALMARAARILPALLLARIDGKSPVEYLMEERQKSFVRGVALALLGKGCDTLTEIQSLWAEQPHKVRS